MIVRSTARRTTTTPNATMTTLASPSLGGAGTSLWLVDMPAGAVGPAHAFAGEVVWAITGGAATLEVDDAAHELRAGDTAVVPGGTLRRFAAGPAGFTAVVATCGPREVTRADGSSAGVPPWVA